MPIADLNHLPPTIREAVWQLVEACQLARSPLPLRCPHGADAQGCCPACTVTHAAEAILAAAQPTEARGEPGVGLRSPLEQQVLGALQALAPLPVTTLQIACLGR